MARIIILVESHEQLAFVLRFIPGIQGLGIVPEIITNKYSIYLEVKCLYNISVSLVKPVVSTSYIPDLSSTVELLVPLMSIEQASLLYVSVYALVESIVHKNNTITFFVLSGNTVASYAVRNAAKVHCLPILFFDRGNYSDKLFVDPWGTNVDSYLYHHLDILDTYGDGKENIEAWIETNSVKNETTLGFVSAHFNYLFLLDVLYSQLTGFPFRGEMNLLTKIHEKFHLTKDNAFRSYDITQEKYYFVPLSHSYEIKKNHSDVAFAFETISNIRKSAEESGNKLFIKYHPAETDLVFMNRIDEMQRQHLLLIVEDDTSLLVKHAQKVFLFNTSVALQVILFNKAHQFVDRSMFENFTRDRVIKYLQYYLIAAELDANGNFTTDTMTRILDRRKLHDISNPSNI